MAYKCRFVAEIAACSFHLLTSRTRLERHLCHSMEVDVFIVYISYVNILDIGIGYGNSGFRKLDRHLIALLYGYYGRSFRITDPVDCDRAVK